MVKKFSAALMFSILFQLSAGALSPLPWYRLNDIDGVDYESEIEWTLREGITQGLNDTTWAPDRCITRAEIVKMLLEYQLSYKGGFDVSYEDRVFSSFSDVRTSDWFYDYVNYAADEGIVEGYQDGTFRPNQCVNRVEAMKITAETLISDSLETGSSPLYFDDKIIDDMESSAWYSAYARTMFTNRLVGTNHTNLANNYSNTDTVKRINFFPADDMSRKEVAKMMFEIDKFVTSQKFDGISFVDYEYNFEIKFPYRWGEYDVLSEGPGFLNSIVNEVRLDFADINGDLILYVVDSDLLREENQDSPYTFKDENKVFLGMKGDFEYYADWSDILESFNDVSRTKFENEIFRSKLSFKTF